MKDAMLIENALKRDKIIITTDREALQFYQDAAQTISELNSIIWIDPTENTDEVIQWLTEIATGN